MTVTDSKSPKPLPYPSQTLERAERALVCSPFHLHLFAKMGSNSVPLKVITMSSGIEQGYTKRSLSELAVEDALSWLIQVGVLRREVDGQGITDSFRLTPLGRQLVEQFQGSSWRQASWLDHVYNTLNRWLRLPF